ncbi:MAG: DUF2846 domain-containing protein, partial [Xanthobacteraceae bacterium]
GCAGPARTGATLDTLTKDIGAPKAGHARVIVIRDKAFPGIFDSGWEVRLDGAPFGDLKTGTFVYRDGRAGPHQLSFERPGDLSRASRQDFAAAPGRTYFFRLDINEKGRTVSAMSSQAGLVGLFVSSAVSSAVGERGLFDFTPLDEATARQAIAELRLAD